MVDKKLKAVISIVVCSLFLINQIIYAQEPLTANQLLEMMREYFYQRNYDELEKIVSMDLRDVVTQTAKLHMVVDESKMHKAYKNMLGVQVEFADHYNTYFENGSLKSSYESFAKKSLSCNTIQIWRDVLFYE